MTAWAFDKQNAFGDMMFFKFSMINKSGKNIDSAHVAFWADIDIGDAQNLVGCDTTLSLGYMYKNQPDAVYGANPPAIGYDFFQGPIVPSPGDTANVSGRKEPGFKNLPMTSFIKYIGGGPPRFSDPEIAEEIYNYMKGFDKLGDPIIDPTTGQASKFWHTGDPLTGTGWLDDLHADKRFLISSGPFALAVSDTQEVVGAIIIAQGNTGVESVELLKRNDKGAQIAYENNFVSPSLPPAPLVTVYPDTASILLVWDSAAEAYSSLDGVATDSGGNLTQYGFQGYNIYQLDAPEVTVETQIKKIAGFDVIDSVMQIRDDVFSEEFGQIVNVVVQNARDTGIQRFLRITLDAFDEDAPLIRNQPYYFAVTTYGYNPFGSPKTLESPMRVITGRPQTPSLGTQLTTSIDEVLPVSHSGPSNGEAVAVVLAPSALTGHSYEVRFRSAGAETVYDVWDATTNTRRDSNRTNQSATGPFDYPVVDGLLITVIGAPDDYKDFLTVANANGPLNPPEYAAFAFNGSGFPHPTTADRPDGSRQQSSGALNAGQGWGVQTGELGQGFGYDLFVSRTTRNGANLMRFIPYDYEIRFTATAGKAYEAFTAKSLMDVPFELWNIGVNTPDDRSDDYRMIPWINDIDENGVFNLTAIDHSLSGGDNDPQTDLFFWMNPKNTTPGSAGYDQFVTEALVGTYGEDSPEVMAHMVLVHWNGGSVSDPAFPSNLLQAIPEAGTVFRILTSKPNSPADVFSFTTPAQVKSDLSLARQQAAALVNVFPNPYKRNIIDLDRPNDQFVTFTHLPEGYAKILIYTISSDLVRKIEHTNGTPYEQWDLRNGAGRQVGSGIYLVHIDMGEIGKKVLKVVVF